MTSVGQTSELQSVIALVKTLTNAQLKDILRSEGLAVSGVKASLQLRIIDYLERIHQTGHLDRYDNLRKFIYAIAHRPFPGSLSLAQPVPSPQYQSTSTNQPTTTQHRPSPLGMSMPHNGSALGILQTFYPQGSDNFLRALGPLSFKDSPFYRILEQLTPTVECKAREQTRDSVELKIVLNPAVASRMQEDPNIRIMVFCAADTGLNQFTKSEIAFPHQVELKANLDEVKANLRGLKNKPGTTRPADVTGYIRKRAGYTNHIVMTYALTQKRFYILANLVERHPVEALVAKLKMRKTITKGQVIQEMKNRANDSDIVATSSVMSLKCPLSTLRIAVPCRSVICTHNQCFDATSFLQLQEQAPTWTCPVCLKATSFESLHTDQYVDEILHSTSTDVEQVIVEPDGRWSCPNREGVIATGGGVTPATDDDDELIEIREPGITPVKQEFTPSASLPFQRTPARSREPSTALSTAHHASSKRTATQIIDLTGSDDDEDESPTRPVKRPALNVLNRPLPRHEFRGSLGGNHIDRRNLPFADH